MSGRDLAVVQGWADTRMTLVAWNHAPFAVVARWTRLSLAIAIGLLAAVFLVATVSTPDPTRVWLYGVHTDPSTDHAWHVFGRNLLVLALHSLACLAGFIAKSSMPAEAQAYSGTWRRVHDRAGPAAIAFVAGATLFSLGTQALVLGQNLATLAPQLGTSPGRLLLALLPHAIPELVALFLPLAAWLIAARSEAWNQLMAATIATTALALPVLLTAAMVEAFVTPRVLTSLHFV